MLNSTIASPTLSNMASTERPAYRVLAAAGFFGPDNTLYEEGSEVYFDGIPAEEMEPLNEPARLKMVAYLEELEDMGRKAAEKLGRPFQGRPRNLEGALALATAIQKQEMNIFGKRDTTSNDITSIEKIESRDVPETGLEQAKRGRGRPKKITSLASAV